MEAERLEKKRNEGLPSDDSDDEEEEKIETPKPREIKTEKPEPTKKSELKKRKSWLHIKQWTTKAENGLYPLHDMLC